MNHKKCLNIFVCSITKIGAIISTSISTCVYLDTTLESSGVIAAKKTILLLHNHPFGFQSDDFYFALVVVSCC